MSETPTEEKRAFAYVRKKYHQPWEREWLKLTAPSLAEAMRRAALVPGVVSVHEVCWDPGYIT